MLVWWATQAYPRISLLSLYEQIVTTIVRMRKIDLNLKDPEPEAEQLTGCGTHPGKAKHRLVLRNAATERTEALGTVEPECRSLLAHANEARA